MGFDSYHWQEFSILDSQLVETRDNLSSGRGGISDFLALLGSDDPVAVGVALDHYKQAEALTRFGGSHPFGGHDADVRDVARRVLEQPPYPSADEDDEPALNHASALLVLGHLATADDSDRIAGIVRSRPSPLVMNAAGQAAACALMASEDLSDNLVDAVASVLLDESGGTRERLDALRAFASLKAPRIGGILARAARTDDEKLQAEVIATLANHFLTTHLDVIEEVTTSWAPNSSRLQARILQAVEAAKPASGGNQGSSQHTGPGME